ncbi:hypothetical protein GCM10008965_31180 [Methylorubrum aminovorans]|nr:hypothetical protein GCM10025880_05890 [Methylorubrum aminovorans]
MYKVAVDTSRAMTRPPNRHPGNFRRQARFSARAADVSGLRNQAAKFQASPAIPDLDERLARELVRSLVRSAIARGSDPVARLQEFRTLQLAAIAMSHDDTVAQTAEQLVRAADFTLQKLRAAKS